MACRESGLVGGSQPLGCCTTACSRGSTGTVDRLGFLTEQMVFEEGSFLKVGVDRELGQLAKAA
jgi:hypothetical protein